MPFPNEHSCRLLDPEDFQDDSFRREERESDGKTYFVIMGQLEGEDTMTEQAYRYPKDNWTVAQARSHCSEHDGILFEPASDEEEEDIDNACCGGEGLRANISRHEPIRCFEGSAKPHEAFWSWRNAGELEPGQNGNEPEGEGIEIQPEGEPEIELYGYISEYSWFNDDITPKMFKDDLYRFGKRGPITVRLNSGGGDLIAASVIKSVLMDYPGRVTVKIDGLAASAATLVAIAGDRVWINESAYFMIHDPLVAFFFAVLNIEELNRLLDSLKAAKNGILDAYMTRTGQSRTQLAHMMSAETWLTAAETVENGFADKVLKVKGRKSSGLQNTAIINAAIQGSLRNYVNVPANLLAPAPPQVGPVVNAAAERLRAEAKLYKK